MLTKFQRDGAEGYRNRWSTYIPAGPGPVRDIAPCLTALGAAIVFSLCFGRFQNTWELAIVRGLLRFFRITLVLCCQNVLINLNRHPSSMSLKEVFPGDSICMPFPKRMLPELVTL